MKNTKFSRLASALALACTFAGNFLLTAAHAQETKTAADTTLLAHKLTAQTADAAWQELKESTHQPDVPPEWNTKPPTPAEQKSFFLPYILAATDKAHDFYTRFAKDTNAISAKQEEYDLLTVAIQIGATNQETRLDNLEKNMLSDPTLTADDRFRVRQHSVERAASRKETEGSGAVMAEFEKGVRALQKEFPGRPEIMQMLLIVASNSEPGKAREIAKEIAASDATPAVKEPAASLLKKLESVGKPLELQFTAVDGRAVDVSAMKGKVILLDFWATWCGPCVGELPHVKEAYDDLHAKGFEIIGISLDNEKQKLAAFTSKNNMAWPQFCDGLGWENKYAQQFGVTSIPAMWLVDKHGMLRDVNGREDLRAKVEKLLAE